MKNKYFAFSLIELMITLITISCIAAAFTPVITKKLKSSNVTIKGNNVSDITTNCSDKFSNSCKLCTKSYCIQCDLSNCTTGTYAESKSCSCKNCSDIHSNCIECDSNKCTKCKDNNYYINNGKCEICPSNKICDGINAHDETYCTNPPDGYYCDNNVIKKCSDKYGVLCSRCTPSACTECVDYYYLSDNMCKSCNISFCAKCINTNICTQCISSHYLNSNKNCSPCSEAIANCGSCNGPSACILCKNGYYVNSQSKCSPCSSISNCINCTSGSNCTQCEAGYYINLSNTCSKCTIPNCASCNQDGTCLVCNKDYQLTDDKKACEPSDGIFRCSDSNFIKIGNLCVTRRNMGDSSTLKIPTSVTIVNTSSEPCYSTSKAKCCWTGTTGSGCANTNGAYSGCTRTVCNYYAAEEICSKFNYAGKKWRLATKSEMQNWAIITIGLGSNGLMLCDRDISSSKIERCGYYEGCYGAPYPYYLCAAFYNYAQSETEDTSGASAVAGLLFSLPSESKITAASVRCVTEME